MTTPTPAAGALVAHLQTISREVFGTDWQPGLEWGAWAELQAHRHNLAPVNRALAELLAPYMHRLDAVQQYAACWVWQIGGRLVTETVPDWLLLCRARATFRWLPRGYTNEEVSYRALQIMEDERSGGHGHDGHRAQV